MNFGETCHAGTRIYCHEDVYDEFLAGFTKKFGAIRVGDNFDENTDQGPQNSTMQFDKIMGHIEDGKKEGATLHLGGQKKETKGGYFIEVSSLPRPAPFPTSLHTHPTNPISTSQQSSQTSSPACQSSKTRSSAPSSASSSSATKKTSSPKRTTPVTALPPDCSQRTTSARSASPLLCRLAPCGRM